MKFPYIRFLLIRFFLCVLLLLTISCIAPGPSRVTLPRMEGKQRYIVRFHKEEEAFAKECPEFEGHEVMRSQKSGACLATSDGEYYIDLQTPDCIRNAAGDCTIDLAREKIDSSRILSIHRWDRGLMVFMSPGRAKSYIVCEVARIDIEEAKTDWIRVRYYEELKDVARPPTGVRVTDVSPDGEWFCGYIFLKDWEINSWAYENFMIKHLDSGESKKVHRSHGEGKFYPG